MVKPQRRKRSEDHSKHGDEHRPGQGNGEQQADEGKKARGERQKQIGQPRDTQALTTRTTPFGLERADRELGKCAHCMLLTERALKRLHFPPVKVGRQKQSPFTVLQYGHAICVLLLNIWHEGAGGAANWTSPQWND